MEQGTVSEVPYTITQQGSCVTGTSLGSFDRN